MTRNEQMNEIVALLNDRDERGLVLLERECRRMFSSVMNPYISDPEIKKEIVQSALCRVWESFDDFNDTKGTIYSWVVTMVKNRAIDITRSKTYKKEYYKTKHFFVWHDTLALGVQNINESKIDMAYIHKVLDRIPPNHSLVIKLSYLRGYSHPEIAEMTGLPLGTVKTGISLGLKEIRKIMRINKK
jgi:RNA polymerase sigma-70 factor (ECF subfamily)